MKCLKSLIKETLLREIFRDKHRPYKPNNKGFAWSVLVVDPVTLRILQSCMQTHELTAENVASVELIHDEKRPPTDLHAIYFLSPDERGHQVFTMLTNDFRGEYNACEFSVEKLVTCVKTDVKAAAKPSWSKLSFRRKSKHVAMSEHDAMVHKQIRRFRKYRSATIYFSRPFVEKYRCEFAAEIGANYESCIFRFSVVQCCIVPVQSAAFTLGQDKALTTIYFAQQRQKEREELFKVMSCQLASVWALLDQYPTMLVRNASQENAELAQKLHLQLEKDLGPTTTNSQSILLVMDRGMDVKTPLMHDLAFQPLVYDLLETEGDFYMSEGNDEVDASQQQHQQKQHHQTLTRRSTRRRKPSGKISSDEQQPYGTCYDVCLTNEDESDWQKLKYLQLPKVLGYFQNELHVTPGGGNRNSRSSTTSGSNWQRFSTEMVQTEGVTNYETTLAPMRSELAAYLTTLASNPMCVLSREVIDKYVFRMLETASALNNRAQLNQFEASNTCLVETVCCAIEATVVTIKSICEKYKFPTHATCDEEKEKLLSCVGQEAIEELDKAVQHLLATIDHYGERLKTEDVYQKQLELAHTIGKLLAQKKLQYFKNAYVHLAVACLEQLRIRDLYEILPLETLCYAASLEMDVSKTELARLFHMVERTVSSKPTFLPMDKARIIILLAIVSGGLEEDRFEQLIRAGGIWESRTALLNMRKLGAKLLKSDCFSQAAMAERETTVVMRRQHRQHLSAAKRTSMHNLPTSTKSITVNGAIKKLSDTWTRAMKSGNPLGDRDPLMNVKVDETDSTDSGIDRDEEEASHSDFEWTPLVAHLADIIIRGQTEQLLKHFRVIMKRDKSWSSRSESKMGLNKDALSTSSCLNLSVPGKPRVRFALDKPSNLRLSTSTSYLPDDTTKNNNVGQPVIMIFIIGGVTHSEIRHIQQLHKKHNPSRNILIGSTHVITPTSFLQELAAGAQEQPYLL